MNRIEEKENRTKESRNKVGHAKKGSIFFSIGRRM